MSISMSRNSPSEMALRSLVRFAISMTIFFSSCRASISLFLSVRGSYLLHLGRNRLSLVRCVQASLSVLCLSRCNSSVSASNWVYFSQFHSFCLPRLFSMVRFFILKPGTNFEARERARNAQSVVESPVFSGSSNHTRNSSSFPSWSVTARMISALLYVSHSCRCAAFTVRRVGYCVEIVMGFKSEPVNFLIFQ